MRNALLGEPLGDIDIATTALPQEVIRPRRGRRLQGGADRHRARHRHRRRRGPPVRGDDAARGCRDLWPPCQGRLRARLAARRRAARLHHERALGRARRHGPRSCRRPRRYRGAARALHRRSRPAHRRGLSAHPALLPLPRRLWRRRARCRRARRLHRGARGPRRAFARARAHGDAQAPAGDPRGADAGGDDGSGAARSGARRRAAARELRQHDQARSGVRARARSGPPPRRARACSSSKTPTGCASGCGSPMPSTSGLLSMADAWWRVSPADGEQSGRMLLYRLGEKFTDRVLLAWSRSPAGVADAAGARWRHFPIAGPRRPFRSRPPISSRAASPKDPRSARRCARPRRRGLQRGFRSMRQRLRSSPTRRWSQTSGSPRNTQPIYITLDTFPNQQFPTKGQKWRRYYVFDRGVIEAVCHG